MKDQETLRKSVEQFMKRGMVLFFSHIFAQAIHPEGIDQFGRTTTQIYSQIPFPTTKLSLMRSNTSFFDKEYDQINLKSSVDFEQTTDLSNGNTHIQMLNSIIPGLNIAGASSHPEKDDNGNKKRVTIFQTNSDNSTPSHKPNLDQAANMRKSILLKSASIPVGIVDTINFQTPSHHDPNLLSVSPTKTGGNGNGNFGYKKLGSLEGYQQQYFRETNQITVNGNKISLDQIDQSPQQTLQNINVNINSLSTINNFEQISSYSNLNNIDRTRLNNKIPLNSKAQISPNPYQMRGSQTNQMIKYQEQQSIQEKQESFNLDEISPQQRSIQVEQNTFQQTTQKRSMGQQLPYSQEDHFQDIKQSNNEGYAQNQQHKKYENQSLYELSPPTLMNRTNSPYCQQNGVRQLVKNNQNNQIDIHRQSTQTSIPQNLNIQVSGSNSNHMNSMNNGSSNYQNQYSLQIGEKSNNPSLQSSPQMNSQQSNVPNHNFNFQIFESKNSITNSQPYNHIYDISLNKQNQFEDNNINYQNQLNGLQTKHITSGINFTSKKQNEQLFEEDKLLSRTGSQQISQIDYNKNRNSFLSVKKPFSYDHLDRQVSNVSISSIRSNFNPDDTYKAKAKQNSGCIKGDMEVIQGKIYNVYISKAHKDYVKIAEGHKYGVFKKKIFNFIYNPELNSEEKPFVDGLTFSQKLKEQDQQINYTQQNDSDQESIQNIQLENQQSYDSTAIQRSRQHSNINMIQNMQKINNTQPKYKLNQAQFF